MISELFENTNFTPQEKVIIDYIKDNPQSIINNNAKELSKKIYVSSPTIIRFVKKLGFKGYLDFQLTYTQEYTLQTQQKNQRLTAQSSIHDIIATLPSIYQQVFIETEKLAKSEAFVRTINYMLQAKQIDFYANDNNYSEIQSACLKLNTIGIRAQCFNTLNTSYLANINPTEILSFVVSHSGSNQTMIDAAYALRKKRIRVIAITGKLSPQLELVCNESLYIDSFPHYLPHSIMLYGLSIRYIIDILYTSLYFKRTKK